jgi:hypothetical protein
MKAHVEIVCDNEAFGDGQHHREIARILRGLASKLEMDTPARLKLYDHNGNHVGKFVLVGGKDD